MGSTDSGGAAIAGVVDRPRLFRILDSSLLRVCVVQGPSGSGKTTLLRSWVLQPDGREQTLWVSLGRGFTTRDAFWRHVASSAMRHGDLSKDAAARAGEELSLAGDPVRIASRLLADVGPVVVILDAYEHLADLTPVIDADLARLLGAVPDLRVMITTRGRTDLVDLDLPGGGMVRVITLAELALTTDEIAALVAAQTGIEDERLALSVGDATRGFPLTVRAVVLALAQLGRIPRVDSMEWDAVVAARLESLLPDPVAVQFVTDTSVPPYVDLELAQQLSGHPAPQELLDMLERNGFGRWIPTRATDRCFSTPRPFATPSALEPKTTPTGSDAPAPPPHCGCSGTRRSLTRRCDSPSTARTTRSPVAWSSRWSSAIRTATSPTGSFLCWRRFPRPAWESIRCWPSGSAWH